MSPVVNRKSADTDHNQTTAAPVPDPRHLFYTVPAVSKDPFRLCCHLQASVSLSENTADTPGYVLSTTLPPASRLSPDLEVTALPDPSRLCTDVWKLLQTRNGLESAW